MKNTISCYLIKIFIITFAIVGFFNTLTFAQSVQMVRIAKLEIYPENLVQYKQLLEEEITSSIKKEPGVLTLYAVAEKDRPNYITIFETYLDEQAYQKHLKSPHFIKYKTTTEKMVKNLELIPCLPISLGAKQKP